MLGKIDLYTKIVTDIEGGQKSVTHSSSAAIKINALKVQKLHLHFKFIYIFSVIFEIN